jgi:uncharacterized protein (TIGR00251 family)
LADTALAYRWDGDDLIICVHVQPRASRNEWVGPHGAGFKLRITAPPVDGKANAHVIDYLAGLFGVAKSQVELLAGETDRRKRLRIRGPRRLPPGITPR